MPPILRPLATRPIAFLWSGLALSSIGDQLFNVVLGWLAAATFGTNAGLLPAGQAAVMLTTALLAGRVADAFSHRHAMIGADLMRAAMLGLMVLVWLVAGYAPGWALVISVMSLAIGNALFRPALMALVPTLAPAPLLPATNALIDTTERIARLLGPGLIGVLAASLPLVHFVTIDVVTFLISAAAVTWALRGMPVEAVPSGAKMGIWANVSRGFRVVRRDRLLGFVLGVTGIINGTWYTSYFIGLPLILVRGGVEGGIGAFGVVISAYGLTNLASTLIVGNRPISKYPGRMIFFGNLFMGSGVVLLGLAGWLLPPAHMLKGLMAAAMVSAIGGPLQDITVATRRQMVLGVGEIAAATRAFVVMNQTGPLIGLALSPLLFATIGVAPTVIVCGMVAVFVSAAGFGRFWSFSTD